MGISAYIGDIERTLPARRLSDDPVTSGHGKIRLKSADLGTERELVCFRIDQEDRGPADAKIVPDDRQNLPQDLIEVEGRENCLARVVEDCCFLHYLCALTAEPAAARAPVELSEARRGTPLKPYHSKPSQLLLHAGN